MTEQSDKCPKCGADREWDKAIREALMEAHEQAVIERNTLRAANERLEAANLALTEQVQRLATEAEQAKGENAKLRADQEEMSIDMGQMQDELAEALWREAKLREVVERLPKTADGVTCAGGEIVWMENRGRLERFMVLHLASNDRLNGEPSSGWSAMHIDDDGYMSGIQSADVDCCYSTRKAAEAAQAPRPSTTKPGPDWFFGADYKGDAILDLQNHGAQASERKEGK